MHPSDLLFRKIEQRPISIPKMIIFIRIHLVLYYLLLRTIWFIGLTKQLQSNVHLNHFRGQGWLLKLDYVHFKLIMHCASPYNSF